MSNKLGVFGLEGKVAVVTGAGAGIGEACARMFAQAGAAVMLSDINVEACERIAAELNAEGLQAKAIRLDVTSEADWEALKIALEGWKNRWDILLNNAGIYIGGMLENNTVAQVSKINQINIESVFIGTRTAAESMKPGGCFGSGGSIINLSSIAGLVGVPGHSIYGATKGAVRSLSKHSAVEFAKFGYGVRVNSLHPGLIETAMGDQALQDFVDIGVVANVDEAAALLKSAMIPMGRLGNVQDIANAALFLASDASSYVTGIELTVDGGFCAA
ncbi:NAD(P)-dependent dehydrogenase (short-subunit alcohol dehydrogenase family) [Zhongshania antarctica]|uniref:NAD(P)-dependent dehydrogenase (Short-subunit alcohol dehydrogenase family) n=1 Tax=Zhongshania antarctica TaxID=641702 RepID=A0A840R622_9GAMM|nr:SDR family oxidoreductase [Zhongshania antarctica]MBB5187998.1 NAD(P)-dependent dehydrogenase (short-subunit alcohol dehydrogenase family) [Zhongshania antarctica]